MSKHVIELTDGNFNTEVEAGAGVTVVDFWAPWCGPCRIVGPMIEQLAEEYQGRVRIGKLNVDENPQTAARYGIRSIPTIGIFKDGAPVDGVVGAVPKPMLQAAVEKYLAE
ncbi:MAG TPA: thioredoxin [Longimicrobiaceae bacterium]|nr:thioredoxin [Longimicrobiaceae bacterium]